MHHCPLAGSLHPFFSHSHTFKHAPPCFRESSSGDTSLHIHRQYERQVLWLAGHQQRLPSIVRIVWDCFVTLTSLKKKCCHSVDTLAEMWEAGLSIWISSASARLWCALTASYTSCRNIRFLCVFGLALMDTHARRLEERTKRLA